MTTTFTPGTTRRAGDLRGLIGGFGNEVGKALLSFAAGRREVILQAATFPVFYLLLVLFMGRGELRAELLMPTLLGMVSLTFIHEQINRAFWSYLGDIQSGTLEQTYLTPLPSWTLVLGRQVAAIITALPSTLAVLVVAIVTMVAHDVPVPFDIQAVVPMLTIVVGTCGLALVLCGLTLVFKRIEIITQVSVAVWFIAGGTFVPLTSMPGWAEFVGRLFIPIAPGIEALRDILIDGASLFTLHTGWGLTWLLLQPLIIVALGAVLFTRLEALAKRRGTLGRY